MNNSKYNFVQVYSIWVNGRYITDVDQHFPVETNVDREWTTDFKKATDLFFNAKVYGSEFDAEIYQDYIVTLFVIDIDTDEFERDFDLEFDISDEGVQDVIPYYADYDFTTVAERIIAI